MLFLLLLLAPIGKRLCSICFLFGSYVDLYIPAHLSFSLVFFMSLFAHAHTNPQLLSGKLTHGGHRQH